jgi:hypothetical protein
MLWLSMKHRALLCILGALASGLIAFSQPSGGPYGPIAQDYSVPTGGRVIYVAPTGTAAAAGESLDSPTTLEAAVAEVVTGDTIVLRGGTYRTGGLRLSQGITMQPYGLERPVLKGTEVAHEWEAVDGGLWRTRWTRLFPAAPADWWRANEENLRRSPLHMFNNDMVFRDGTYLQAVGDPADLDEDTYYIDYPAGWVYLGADPTGQVIEITAHNSALTRTMREAHGKPNDGIGPTIRGITFTQYARLALLVEGVEPDAKMDPSEFGKEIIGTTLEHLTISHCSRVAGYFRGDNLTIRHCLVSDCGTEGIYVINSADVLLEHNIVTRINSAENLVGYYATAVKIFNQSYDVICRDNLIIDNPNASGVWYDVGNVDGVFINNWVETTPNGFFFEISNGVICTGNVFVDCGRGVWSLNSRDVHVYQNTFFNSAATFQRTPRSHTAGDHFGWHASTGPAVDERRGHVFKNNLLVGDAQFGRPLLDLRQSDTLNGVLTDSQLQGLDGNVYVQRTGKAGPPMILWSPVENDSGNLPITDLDDLRALHPHLTPAGSAYPEYFGPLFKGEHLKRFTLLPEFPGSDVGVGLPPAVNALLGWDGGAFPGAYSPVQ